MEKSTKTNFLRAFITEVWFRSLVWFRLYGLESILLHLFACSQIWCMVHQLVDSGDRQPCKSNEISRAMEFSNATRSGSETVELSNATTSKSETVKSSNVTRSDMIRLFRESELAVCNTTTVAVSPDIPASSRKTQMVDLLSTYLGRTYRHHRRCIHGYALG